MSVLGLPGIVSYASSGVLAPYDDTSVLTGTSALAMSLAVPGQFSRDRVIVNTGTATHTVGVSINGTATSLSIAPGAFTMLRPSASAGTWFAIGSSMSIATAASAGLIKPGFGVTAAVDGTLDAHPAARMGGRYNLVLDGGVVPSATVDNTAALNAALARATQLGMEAYLPPLVNPDGTLGSYLVSGVLQVGGVNTPGSCGRIAVRGVKGQTRIRQTSATAHGLHVGNGTQLTDGQGEHLIEGLHIDGPGATLRNGAVGILLDAATRAVVRDCGVSGFDIGYDMINNCYLSLFQNCDAGLGGTCNVGANCRSDAQTGCGNQIAFDNCRLGGIIAGVNVGAPVNGSENIDGISIRNGQIGCQGGTDDCGCVRIGIDYLTGSTGGTGKVLIDTVDMEQFAGWGVRAYGQVALTWRDCPVISTGAGIGLWKITNGGNGTLVFEGLDVAGAFSSPVACSYAGYGGTTILERATAADGVTFAGVAAGTCSMLAQSGTTACPVGRYEGLDYGGPAGPIWDAVYSAGTWSRVYNGAQQVSHDRVTWTTLASTTYVTTQIQAVVGSAPAALATLQAIDAQLSSDESAAGALTTIVSGHTTQIGTNTSNISANTASINTNTASIATLQGQVGVLVPARTVTSGSSVTMLATDGVVRINKTNGSATAVTLEANPAIGATHTVKDAKGDASLNPITVSAASSGTIDGASSYVLNSNRQAVTLQWGGNEWSVL